MVDWLTVELPDPVGIPINAGQVMRISRDGEIEWTVPTRRVLEGSWSSNMTFRALGAQCTNDEGMSGSRPGIDQVRDSGLEISGNPNKWLHGHNLFGLDCPTSLLEGTIERAKNLLWPDLPFDLEIDISQGLISRIDLTASWMLDRPGDVLPVLKAMEENVWCPYRGRGVFDAGGSTLYYGRTAKGKRAKDWALKLYWKGPEVTAHPLPGPALAVPGLLDDLNRTIRVELTLRAAELKRLDLRKVGQWTPAKVREIWEAYVGKLPMETGSVNLDTVDLGELGLKPRHVHAIAAWKAGNDLRAGMSRPSFYRLRKELREATGYDIAALCPKSNVVPLRRVVTVAPAQNPTWADHLTEALRRAA